MKPSLLSAQLALCPSLGDTAVVGLDLTAIDNLAPRPQPIACLLLAGEEADRNDLQNATRQSLLERFDVLLLLDSSAQGTAHALERLDDLRAELWLALVGWKPAPAASRWSTPVASCCAATRAACSIATVSSPRCSLAAAGPASPPRPGMNASSTNCRR